MTVREKQDGRQLQCKNVIPTKIKYRGAASATQRRFSLVKDTHGYETDLVQLILFPLGLREHQRKHLSALQSYTVEWNRLPSTVMLKHQPRVSKEQLRAGC